MRIVAVHLLNDYSGSPKVLMQLLKCWTKNSIPTLLYTCGGRKGFLSNIPDVKNHNYWYRFAENKLIRLLFLVTSQLILMCKLLFQLKRTDILYINTVLPFGAGIAGKLIGCKIIYHIHETSIKPRILKKVLFFIVKISASEVVYVSHFLASQESLNLKKKVLYNVLEKDFLKRASSNSENIKNSKIVLMICSLKSYKGVNDFLTLAKKNSSYVFKLIVNASSEDIETFFKNDTLPPNLIIYPTQTNTHSFYSEASLILNLSDVNNWVETFGLTILEGMAYGLPAIVPPVGGVTELVEDGVNGFRINSKDIDGISKKINSLLSDPVLYLDFSKKAIEKSLNFNTETFEKEAIMLVSKLY
jgi:L-malate glycosyltransferase